MTLEVRDLEAGYGKAQVLNGLDLEVKEGELVALLGANGAGKTTLLRAISGLIPPWRGKVLWNGEELRRFSPARRARFGLGHVPEGRQLFPLMTVEENLRLGAAFLAPEREKEGFERVFALFPRLYERKRQLAGTLSGGEQQMLAIARALMGFPKILLVDEPSLGLAPRLAEEVLLTLKRVAEEGVGVLLVEQNVALSLEVAARAYVLEHGRIVLQGPSRVVLEDSRIREAYLSL
ncbi:ABC transporter ATP-binding protein [Thermus caldifontis]|uniref:ABC transporter ATP-binding protein n=1 Tax=Thermus caldifontis TaxID=1930763 RepID=UPI000DF435EF|nr:ABC transporter ATP-binding protein [Thermus caldifontis]